MIRHARIPLNLIRLLMPPTPVHGTHHGHTMALNWRQSAPALRPPPQLARIGENDARRRRVRGRAALLGQRADQPQHRSMRDAAPSTDYTVCQHAEGLAGLTDEEDDTGGGAEVGRGEDGDMRLGGPGAEREGESGKFVLAVEVGEAGEDDITDCFCEVAR